MSKRNKQKQDIYEDEEDYLDNDTISDNEQEEEKEESLEYLRHEGENEGVKERPTIDNFFDTENLLYSVEKTMKGFQKRNGEWVYTTRPKARDSFINSMINSLRSVINQQNMISRVTKDEADYLLLEKNKEFIFLLLDEPSVDDEDFETLVNIFDHALQLFMGQVIEGFGARTFRQTSANVSYEVPEEKKDDGIFNFGIGNSNMLKIGGKR